MHFTHKTCTSQTATRSKLAHSSVGALLSNEVSNKARGSWRRGGRVSGGGGGAWRTRTMRTRRTRTEDTDKEDKDKEDKEDR